MIVQINSGTYTFLGFIPKFTKFTFHKNYKGLLYPTEVFGRRFSVKVFKIHLKKTVPKSQK